MARSYLCFTAIACCILTTAATTVIAQTSCDSYAAETGSSSLIVKACPPVPVECVDAAEWTATRDGSSYSLVGTLTLTDDGRYRVETSGYANVSLMSLTWLNLDGEDPAVKDTGYRILYVVNDSRCANLSRFYDLYIDLDVNLTYPEIRVLDQKVTIFSACVFFMWCPGDVVRWTSPSETLRYPGESLQQVSLSPDSSEVVSCLSEGFPLSRALTCGPGNRTLVVVVVTSAVASLLALLLLCRRWRLRRCCWCLRLKGRVTPSRDEEETIWLNVNHYSVPLMVEEYD
ncbi:hypothetical protein KM540_gp006 [Western grey kangaroopox virus]|uniref:Uncharacterized protein n=1 Tax=Western grey kangaroopox virus TaxID=1566307 RepID=A0A2C9DSF4_9POXV|nr:hypothetical protein KM540_gp006 [Western grey kangaroopox virus]ATI20937.1 hypothetical protein [Western grey kangaroopox virus]